MCRKVLAFAILFASIYTFGKTTDSKTPGKTDTTVASTGTTEPTVYMTYDSDYLNLYQAVPLIFPLLDSTQKTAFEQAATAAEAQLKNLASNGTVDPTGDLSALSSGVSTFSQNLGILTNVITSLYGYVDRSDDPSIPSWLAEEATPTGMIGFGTIEYDKNLIKIPGTTIAPVTGGGSLTVGMIFVPMKVQRIPLQPGVPVPPPSYTVDTAFVVIPTANFGASVGTTAQGSNWRWGAGLIWGTLTRASDVNGLTIGPSGTLGWPKDLSVLKVLPTKLQGDNINFKLLALHRSGGGAISNIVGMVGIENQTQNGEPLTPNVNFLGMDAEIHWNISYMYSIDSFLSPLSNVTATIVKPSDK